MNTNRTNEMLRFIECVKCALLSNLPPLRLQHAKGLWNPLPNFPLGPVAPPTLKKNGGRLVIHCSHSAAPQSFQRQRKITVSIRHMMRYVPFSLIASMATPECWPQNMLAWHRIHVSRVFQTLLYITSLPQKQGLGEELEHLSSQRMAPQIANWESWHPKSLLIVSWL